MAKAPPPKQKIEEQAPAPDPLLTLAQLEEQARARLGLIAPPEPGTSLETALARIAESEEAAIVQLAQPEPMPLSCDRFPGEPLVWFNRFEVFRDNGTNRSLLGVYKREKRPKVQKGTDKTKIIFVRASRHWRDAAQAWDWLKRANDFDEWQYRERKRKRALKEKLQEQAEQEERKAQAAIRRSMLNIYAGLWLDALPKLQFAKVGLKALSDGMTAFLTQSRLEYEDQPNQSGPSLAVQINNNNQNLAVSSAQVTAPGGTIEELKRQQEVEELQYFKNLYEAVGLHLRTNYPPEPEPTEEEEEEEDYE